METEECSPVSLPTYLPITIKKQYILDVKKVEMMACAVFVLPGLPRAAAQVVCKQSTAV